MTSFKLCKLSVLYDYEAKPFTYIEYIEYMNLSDKENKHITKKEQTKERPPIKEFVPYYPEDKHAHLVKLPLIDGRLRTKVGNTWEGVTISNGSIVEMIYDVNADIYNRWTPIRVRKDKDTPNSYKTAIDIWKSYYMPVTLDIIKGNTNIPSIDEELDTYYNNDPKKSFSVKDSYRHFHRLVVKHSILLETVGQTKTKKLLDLGSGKGGDISRYRFGFECVGVDNSVDNLHNSGDGAYRRLCNEYDNKSNVDKDKIIFIAGDVNEIV